jgi:hypothetical protein
VVVTVASGVQQEPKVACDLDGNAIIAWMDERGSFADIYAQRFTSDGHWGHPEPTAAFCRDVPGDQGGHVNVAWDASQYDAIGQITRYTIWRAISGPLAADMLESGAALLPSAADLLPFATDPSPALSGPVIRMERLGAAT